jgi:hypothetical protein
MSNLGKVVDGIVCPKCLERNSLAASCCQACGAPLGIASTLDPIQQIHAEGFAYRSAVEGKPKLIVLVGVWLVTLPFIVSSVLWTKQQSSIAATIPGIAFALIGLALSLRVTAKFLIGSKIPKHA